MSYAAEQRGLAPRDLAVKVLESYQSGKSADEIAESVGLNRSAVYRVIEGAKVPWAIWARLAPRVKQDYPGLR